MHAPGRGARSCRRSSILSSPLASKGQRTGSIIMSRGACNGSVSNRFRFQTKDHRPKHPPRSIRAHPAEYSREW